MALTQSEKENLELKFTGVYSRIDSNMELIHETLKRIEAQTIKTNGRVNSHDEKLTILERFRWQVLGGIAVVSVLFTILLTIIKVDKTETSDNKTKLEITTRGGEDLSRIPQKY